MIFLAIIFSLGWPKERTEWMPYRTPAVDVAQAKLGRRLVRINTCCGSMRPSIEGGEFAYVEDYRPGMELHEGEVVSDGKVLHRIVALSEKGVRLSGDANAHSEPWEPRSNLQYIVRVIVRPNP